MARAVYAGIPVESAAKRTRESCADETESQNMERMDCAVCLDTIVDFVFPFDCGHPICETCDKELFARADDRCPTCRGPRLPDSIYERTSSTGVRSSDTDVSALVRRRSGAIAQRDAELTAVVPVVTVVIFFPLQAPVDARESQFVEVD